MVYCKKFFILFLILFVLFLNVGSVFATDDTANFLPITPTVINGLGISNNTIIENSDYNIGYFALIKGHTYRFVNTGYGSNFALFSSDSLDVGSSVQVAGVNASTLPSGSYLDIEATKDYFLSYYQSYNVFGNAIKVYDITPGLSSAVDNLVDNVGINSLWGVFGNTTSYILIVVSVALGLFLLFCVIRGISKTKTKF